MGRDIRDSDLPFKTAGLEFVEFATQEPAALGEMFTSLGFKAIARHVSKNVTLYRQGDMNFLINAEVDSFAHRWAEEYGVGICALGIRVNDAQRAYDRAVELGAWPAEGEPIGPAELVIPAIQGVGDTHLYFVDRWRGKHGAKGGLGDISIYDIDFRPLDPATAHEDWHHAGVGLARVDHLTQTVGSGRLQDWIDFYRNQLGFREIHELHANWHVAADSRVMVSSCGTIRIPLYEEGTHRAHLMHAYLPDHPGEGVQHIALATDDILGTAAALAANGLTFVEPPPRYYDTIDARLPGHGLDLDALRRYGVLVDGDILNGTPRLFLQTFVKRHPGEIFFEIVQRRGHHGFGEGNLPVLTTVNAAMS